jgi:transcriptional regulator with XRE-family HTH domain
MNSVEIANYLEKIRSKKNMSQDDFVSGIVSVRQYQRYKSGDSIFSEEKIDLFAEKLGLSNEKIINDIESEKGHQYNKLNKFYNAVANNDYRTAIILKEELDNEIIISDDGKMYFEYAKIIYKYYSRKMSISEVTIELSELIDYPNILGNKYFTDIEILIISFFLNIFSGKKQDDLLDRLNEIFRTEGSILARECSQHIYSLILMREAKIYGTRREYEKVIFYCDKGIEKGLENKQYYLWDYFFYFKALAHNALDQKADFDKSLLSCFNVLYMESNQQKIDKFTTLIEKDFNIDFKKYVVNLLYNK